MTRLLIVGWDAADWKVIDPLLKRGEMPNLAKLLAEGVRGNLTTNYPPLSPMVWTTIATGKRPTKHGIHGFTEPTEDGLAIRPVSVLGRTTKALWNILGQNGKRGVVVGWWPSHPAEPIRGVMVSNHFPLEAHDKPDRPLMPGTVFPPGWAERLADLRVHFTDITGDVLTHFVPEWRQVDQKNDKSLQDLAGIIAETASIHAAATELLQQEEWDLAAVYYTGIDHFSHRFMRYHARKAPRSEGGTDPALFRDIVVNAYRYHDAMLGRLLALAGSDTAVIIVSDHGFHSDRMLPDRIPAEAAGPSVEHRDFGVFCLKGPGVLQGQEIYGASVQDVAPTALHLFGLPIGRDMDGKVLVNAFESQTLSAPIASWDDVPGEDGRHPPERQYDGAASVEALNQLVALGYIEAPDDDDSKTVQATIAENRYNLARAHMDAGRPDLAAAILRELIADDPEQFRYQQHLFQCLLEENLLSEASKMLQAFNTVCADMAERTQTELARRRKNKPDAELKHDRFSPDRKEMLERRKLMEKVGGYALERLLLGCRLMLAEIKKPGRKEAARALLEGLAENRRSRAALRLFLAEGFALVGDNERALEFVRKVRRADRENWRGLTLESGIHHQAGRLQEAADRAIDSLALVYFQPQLHYQLGTLLVKLGEIDAAEQELRVALSQAPGMPKAHELLARIMRKKGNITEASLHMAQAEVLRKKLREKKRVRAVALPAAPSAERAAPAVFERGSDKAPADRAQVVTIVTGLPRTGTSMMMQMLAAGGVTPFTDGLRIADESNPRGYLEHVQATRLHRDKSWIPDSRGKAVKIVAPLLPHLSNGEQYRVIFMHRDLQEVVASQTAMLARLERQGGKLDHDSLMRTYAGHLVRAQVWLEQNAEIPVIAISYAEALKDPSATASRLALFLGAPFDPEAAARSVDTTLRHQLHGEASVAA